MDVDSKIAIMVQTVSHQGGRIDALTNVLLSLLRLARETPALRQAMEVTLERRYADLLAGSENPEYVAGFETVRDAIASVLDGAGEAGLPDDDNR